MTAPHGFASADFGLTAIARQKEQIAIAIKVLRFIVWTIVLRLWGQSMVSSTPESRLDRKAGGCCSQAAL